MNDLFGTKEGGPWINAINNILQSPEFQKQSQRSRKIRLMKLIKRHPEVFTIISHVSSDIVGKFRFEPINGSSGRNRIQKAQDFSRYNRFNQIYKDSVFDMLGTGEGFTWLGIPNRSSIKEAYEYAYILKYGGLKENIPRMIMTKEMDDEIMRPRKIKPIASTSMTIMYDAYNVSHYIQTVSEREKRFELKEIIRTHMGGIDGSVEGFTPLMTLPVQLELLWLMWNNQYNLQSRGGHPDKIFVAKNMDTNHPLYTKTESALRRYNTPGSPNRGSLLLTGDINVHDISRNDSLEFRDVGTYVMTLIASMWQFPLTRLGIKTAEASQGKDSTGAADRGYWMNIERVQDMISETYNTQLWEPYFGVRMVHDKSYLHDEVVEGNALQLKLGNIRSSQEILRMTGKKLTQDALLRLVNGYDTVIYPEDLEEDDSLMMMMDSVPKPGTPAKNQGPIDNNAIDKRNQELDREKNRGKPTGMGA